MFGRKYSEKNNTVRTNTEKSQEDKVVGVKWRLFDLFIHDLTEPLSIVSTSTDSLLHKVDQYGPLTDHQKRLLDRVSRNIRKAKRLTQEMIEILRSEEGVFKKEYFSIEKTLMESLLDVFEMSIPNAVERLSKCFD